MECQQALHSNHQSIRKIEDTLVAFYSSFNLGDKDRLQFNFSIMQEKKESLCAFDVVQESYISEGDMTLA